MIVAADVKTVAQYIDAQPKAARAVLRRVRAAIRKALPGAKETISYRIPTYRLDDRAVIYFAGWKKHYSLYPCGSRIVAAFKEELAPYEIEKSTIRFPLSEPVPATLIAGIATLRAKEAAARTRRS
jgi:uncharacterized protein YdhG (YjbR/CyaY superfamily)